MIKNLLWRIKKLLDLEDDSQDTKLILLIENALYQIKAYIHSENISGLEPIIAQYVAYLYTSGEGGAASSSSSSSSSGGGIEPKIGELKKESYSNVSFEYTTTADFVNKSSSKSSNSTGGIDNTYFGQFVAPLLKSRRKIMTLSNPYVEESPERY